MKKILLSLGAILLGAAMANADVVIQSTSQSYTSLQDAVTAASDADVLLVNGSVTLPNSRMGIAKSITIKGNTEDATIVRGRADKNILINSGAKVTFENITFDGGAIGAHNNRFMEVSASNTKAYFNNVKFANFNLPSGLIEAKSNGTVELNGVKSENNNCTKGDVFVGSNGSKLIGDNSISVYLEKTINITAENLTNANPIEIFVDFPNRTNGSTVISGCDDAEKFIVSHPYYYLTANNGNLVATLKVIVDAAGNNYTELPDAVEAVKDLDNPELTLVSDCRLPNKRVTISNNLTIKAAEGSTPAFIRWYDTAAAILINNMANVTFEEVKFDMAGRVGKNHFIEVTAGNTTATFKNVTFFNFPETYRTENINNGYLRIVSNAAATIENVKFDYGKEATAIETGVYAGPIDVNINTGNVTLVGDNDFSIYVNGTHKIKTGALTNEKPMFITLENSERVFVEGADVADNFASSTLDYEVVADADGNTALAVAPFVKIAGNPMVFTEIADGVYRAQGAVDGAFNIRTKQFGEAGVYYSLADNTTFATATELPLSVGDAAIDAPEAEYIVLFDVNAKTLALHSHADIMPEQMYMHGTFWNRHFDLGWPVEPTSVTKDNGITTFRFDGILLEAASDDENAAYFVLSSWKADASELESTMMKAAPNAMTTDAIMNKAAQIEGHRYYADFASMEVGQTQEGVLVPHVAGVDAQSSPVFKVTPGHYDIMAQVSEDGNHIMSLGYQGVTTGIESVSTAEAAVVNVYSLQGVLIRAGVEAEGATDGLPAGLYIVGGRKVYVK